jgi:beta propeller repeat protein
MVKRILLAALVSLFPLAAAAQGEPVFSGVETRLTTDPTNQVAPSISGNWVVYTDYRDRDADVWYVDILTGEERPVSTAVGDQFLTDISNGRIVYQDYSGADVKLFDIATGTTENLTASAGSVSENPAISHDLVAWVDYRDGDPEIYGLNLSTREQRRL